ncbi:glycine--tRNA ligase subunit beta [Streptococcus moroccensis]|uniref:Glycine--tRNA ligase beta subunit n=1 Tax=Streptococcus moroccensis TaxID=1451356 RepID=A0ABT9YTT3_9STRE|nr:glycine--tRNA ligase subunit beta [Streptococcus moroccensis]MDQ0223409.1 glycyl-tRNA synthetase beta chain [Streptococcus moroccensis]
MTKNLLIELGLEEMPAYIVTPAMEQLRDRLIAFLKDSRLSFERVEAFSTPRRLAVRVSELADKQDDLTEDFKGPAKKIALDADGNFTKAAEGFVRGKGLTTDAITFREVNGEEYVYVTKEEAGQPVEAVLAGVADVLKSMTFPVSMHWAGNSFEYVRPVHTLAVLLDDQALALDFLDISASRVSRGHRFLGQEIELTSADSYEDQLREVYVIANPNERENMIIEQIRAIEASHDVKVEIDEDLLSEVLNLVEYPTAFLGQFDERYLAVPEEVLVTSMKNHQRYFVVRDAEGKLLPYFVSVRNGNDQHLDNVVKGNQKVLVARLEDAEFFWREDQKLHISDLVAKLQNVNFHEKIGSLTEHMARTKAVAQVLVDMAGVSAEDAASIERAADIYKFDLLTGMVGEFDELQGVLGEKYARLAGESEAVSVAIREHYMPTSADGDLPDTVPGAILAIADKLDTLLSFFSVGLIPSGSNDPYALRRATAGIVRILDKFGWNLSLNDLVDCLFALNLESLSYANQTEVMAFFKARIEKMFDTAVPKDIVTAVLASNNFVVRDLIESGNALLEASKADSYKASVESLARVFNLAEKADATVSVDTNLFENAHEKALYDAVENLELSGSAEEQVSALFALSPAINAFFDNTMVMVDNEAVKGNRLALLANLTAKASQVAQFNQLNTK